MMNCEQATRLASDAQDRPLTLSEQASLRLHTLICVGCRRFNAQMGVLRQAMQGLSSGRAAPPADGGDTGGKPD
jgi:hypothetical protein